MVCAPQLVWSTKVPICLSSKVPSRGPRTGRSLCSYRPCAGAGFAESSETLEGWRSRDSDQADSQVRDAKSLLEDPSCIQVAQLHPPTWDRGVMSCEVRSSLDASDVQLLLSCRPAVDRLSRQGWAGPYLLLNRVCVYHTYVRQACACSRTPEVTRSSHRRTASPYDCCDRCADCSVECAYQPGRGRGPADPLTGSSGTDGRCCTSLASAPCGGYRRCLGDQHVCSPRCIPQQPDAACSPGHATTSTCSWSASAIVEEHAYGRWAAAEWQWLSSWSDSSTVEEHACGRWPAAEWQWLCAPVTFSLNFCGLGKIPKF